MKRPPSRLIKWVIALFLIFLFNGLISCVTKKKLKESQELQSTYILDQTETKFTNSVQNLKSEISKSILSEFNETIKSFKESSTANENESASISGTLPPGEKETSVTVGNTTIKNNGGNVSFDIKSSKQLSSQLETINKELAQSLNEERNARISLENELNEFKTAQLKVNEELKAEKKTQSKETNKKGLSFWVIMIALILAVLFVAYKIYSKRLF